MEISLINQRTQRTNRGRWDRTVILPADLTGSVGKPALIKLCLDAVQGAGPTELARARQHLPGARPEMFMTLLTYCYATGLYDSRDIASAIRSDSTLRYIGAGSRPDWQTLRRFRRNNRDLLRTALVHVFKQTWAFHLETGEADYVGYDWLESELVSQLSQAAADRLDVAAWLDGSDAE